MSFQAKRLRVQLPCGDATVIEEEAQAAQGCVRGTIGCAFPTRVCEGGTCWFETPINCGFVSPCGGFASFCDFHTACRLITVCKFDTCGLTRPKCFVFTAVECPPLTDLQAHPGRVLVDPEHLPVLREALEAQLKEIEGAERALEERQSDE